MLSMVDPIARKAECKHVYKSYFSHLTPLIEPKVTYMLVNGGVRAKTTVYVIEHDGSNPR